MGLSDVYKSELALPQADTSGSHWASGTEPQGRPALVPRFLLPSVCSKSSPGTATPVADTTQSGLSKSMMRIHTPAVRLETLVGGLFLDS